MPQYKVTHQDMPFNNNDPRIIVVEAPTPEDAWVTVYDHLTRKGKVVLHGVCLHLRKTINAQRLAEMLGNPSGVLTTTQIIDVREHAVKFEGKVIG